MKSSTDLHCQRSQHMGKETVVVAADTTGVIDNNNGEGFRITGGDSRY
jgi:hypothetical protein